MKPAPKMPAGPGRPRKPRAPRNAHQAELATDLEAAETVRDRAAKAYSKSSTVAAELRLIRAEVGAGLAWAAYLRSQGVHSHALQYLDVAQKFAGRATALREIAAVDELEALVKKAGLEDALGKG